MIELAEQLDDWLTESVGVKAALILLLFCMTWMKKVCVTQTSDTVSKVKDAMTACGTREEKNVKRKIVLTK